MSFGKLYGYEGNARSTVCFVLAKANKLDIEIVKTVPPTNDLEYQKLHPLDLVPTFVGQNDFVLTEVMAISIYFASQNEKTTLLGKTKQDYAQIVRWMSFGNAHVLPHIGSWFRPLVGRDPYNKANVEKSQQYAEKALYVLEQHLLVHTYLVGERITLADLFMASMVLRGFEYVLDKRWRNEHPNTTRWYETVTAQPIWRAAVSEVKMCDEAVKYTPPKKEPKAAKVPAAAAASTPKAAKKPAQEEEDEEEDAAKPEPKPKHPLEALSKPTLILDDWKRKYSNEDTRPVALPWFWENYKEDEYSLWRVDYKYNDELTLTFMSNNLIGGFFTRLEASRKYLFGAASVYGTTNDSIIRGAFIVRGEEAVPAFDVAPDWESYEFTKLDPHKTADKEFLEDMWAWDKPIEGPDGKKYDWADGKVFK